MEDIDRFATAFENGGYGVCWGREFFVKDLRWYERVVLQGVLVRGDW